MSLLNEGRELLEQMIDTAHEAGATEGRKPRTCRNNARHDWLRFARDRKPTRKKIRKAIRQQLGCQAGPGLSGRDSEGAS